METILYVIIFVFISYRIYLRVRRSIGWQQLKARKIQLLSALSLIVGLIFLTQGAAHLISLISDAAGIAIGFVLAYYGAAMTRIEQRDGHWYYRPNTWIATLVTAIFIGRLLFRIYDIYALGTPGGSQSALTSLSYDPGTAWTSGLMLIMFAYFVTYYFSLLRKQKHLLHSSSR